MIYGTGIDIIETSRIKQAITDKFIEKIFSQNEIDYCEKKKEKHISYAGHFAAKEAFVKALQTGISKGINFKDIEIHHQDTGAPYIILKGTAKEYFKDKEIKTIHLSISHVKEMATAMVILEK